MTGRADKPRRGAIDWQAGHAQLARAAALMVEALSPSPEHTRAIMDARALVLARAPEQKPAPGDELDLVIFRLGGERYAIECRFVCEIMRAAHRANIPRGTGMFLGATNLRGEILGVVDPYLVLALPPERRTDTPWLLVLGEVRPEFAVPVDSVETVARVRADGLTEAAEATGASARPYVRGVGTDALVVLDGAALLADRRLFAGKPNGAAEIVQEGVLR